MATKRKRTTRPRKGTTPRKPARRRAAPKAHRRKPGPHKGAVGAGLFATRRGKPKRAKAKRKPMSAAARKAFRERMEAARAAKGNRGRRFENAPHHSSPQLSQASLRDPIARHGGGPTNRGRGRRRSNTTSPRKAHSAPTAAAIVSILRAAGFDARYFHHADHVEIVTNAPESACLEAARAAGA